jgi:protease-4
MEKKMAQEGVDRIYLRFKQRVAEGRKKDTSYIDSIAQGRVWSGEDAVRIGLVDRIGNLGQAIASAARMAKLNEYGVKEYPESQSWLDDLLNRKKKDPSALLKEQLGEDNYKVYRELLRIREMTGSTQARLPFEFIIH